MNRMVKDKFDEMDIENIIKYLDSVNFAIKSSQEMKVEIMKYIVKSKRYKEIEDNIDDFSIKYFELTKQTVYKMIKDN